MRFRRTNVVAVATLVAAGWLAISASAQQGAERLPALREAFGDTGQAVDPDFEGWGTSQDGASHLIVLGYMNRNKTQTLEIPVGPNNRIEPGGPDYGQPTVFVPGRQTTVFA